MIQQRLNWSYLWIQVFEENRGRSKMSRGRSEKKGEI